MTDVIIPVFRPCKKDIISLVKRLNMQTLKPENIFIMQTIPRGEEKDILELEYDNVSVHEIPGNEFDHGGTRDKGAKLSKADYILFMTQDALPRNKYMIENMLNAFKKKDISIVYARQIPKKNANEIERFTRKHNYPEKSMEKGREDERRLGIKTYFCSDVCAMYDRKIYEEFGGFDKPMIFNEDMIMAYRQLKKGYKIFYSAEAMVFHSHNYTCMQQFRRNFDLGVSQKQHKEIFEGISSEKEGLSYVKNMVSHLLKKGKVINIIYFCIQCAFRLAGYKLGKNYEKLPRKMILRLTGSKWFWEKEAF